jgi:hypothetical protein
MLKLKDTEWTGSTPIAPQLIGCHQTNLQIRDPHQISYRFDVFKTKSMIWQKKKDTVEHSSVCCYYVTR